MSEQPIGKLSPEQLQTFGDLQSSEHELYRTIGQYVVEMMNLASQATQVRLQQRSLGEQIRADFEIPPASGIRLAASGEVFVDESPSE